MTKCLIVPYFGKFPNYFQLTLDSCGKNLDYDWLVFTDNKEEYEYPVNVKKIEITFEKFREIVRSKFDFNILLETPYKLCDYKVAYGYILQEYIKDYEWWGYCDFDVIFGNINHFISEEMLQTYDKLFVFGHFTMFKNTEDINRLFMSNYKGIELYKKYFRDNNIWNFDEMWKDSINNIFEQENKRIFYTNYSADIYPKSADLKCIKLELSKKNISKKEKTKGFFLYNNGEIERYYIKNKKLEKEEFMYIHLQKRKMKYFKEINRKIYKIISDSFENLEVDIEKISVENFKKIKTKELNLDYCMKKLKYNYLVKKMSVLLRSVNKKIKRL